MTDDSQGDKIINARLAESIEGLQKQLDASRIHSKNIQADYDELLGLFNAQRNVILGDLVEAI